MAETPRTMPREKLNFHFTVELYLSLSRSGSAPIGLKNLYVQTKYEVPMINSKTNNGKLAVAALVTKKYAELVCFTSSLFCEDVSDLN